MRPSNRAAGPPSPIPIPYHQSGSSSASCRPRSDKSRLLTDLHQIITRLDVMLVWLGVAPCRVCRVLAIGPSCHWGFPVAPDVVECQDHEPDQRLSTPPLVPHLLQEAKHTVGPLHMIVGPYSPADWVVQVGHQLGELLLI